MYKYDRRPSCGVVNAVNDVTVKISQPVNLWLRGLWKKNDLTRAEFISMLLEACHRHPELLPAFFGEMYFRKNLEEDRSLIKLDMDFEPVVHKFYLKPGQSMSIYPPEYDVVDQDDGRALAVLLELVDEYCKNTSAIELPREEKIKKTEIMLKNPGDYLDVEIEPWLAEIEEQLVPMERLVIETAKQRRQIIISSWEEHAQNLVQQRIALDRKAEKATQMRMQRHYRRQNEHTCIELGEFLEKVRAAKREGIIKEIWMSQKDVQNELLAS